MTGAPKGSYLLYSNLSEPKFIYEKVALLCKNESDLYTKDILYSMGTLKVNGEEKSFNSIDEIMSYFSRVLINPIDVHVPSIVLQRLAAEIIANLLQVYHHILYFFQLFFLLL